MNSRAAQLEPATVRATPEQPTLDHEWERIELLAHCLTAIRRGEEPADALLTRLRDVQALIGHYRASAASAWQGLAASKQLGDFERDILAALLAPELYPRVGWLYQHLHGGQGSTFATHALVQELLALRGEETAFLRLLLAADGVLARLGLVRVDGDDPYQPVRVEPRTIAALLGQSVLPAPPGARRVDLEAHWNELVLPRPHLRMLEEFLFWVRHRDDVVRGWGGQDVGGPIALFSGPSGTGKTYAAAVIARDLGWPLYRVDLGQLVSKYIGETEKNLNRLFDAAHGEPMVLQFDEADALLGKRGEVKEARDRYANLEVSHLLARIEQHRGPCILTTNLRGQIDSAFTRRFQSIIEFPRPDASARALLWDRLLPRRAPRSDDLDLASLGAVNLTGGQIRNAALHAAYLAAAERGKGDDDQAVHAPGIAARHAAIAIWRELGKAGRTNPRSELGALATDLPAQVGTENSQ